MNIKAYVTNPHGIPPPQVGIEDAIHTALLTLKEGFEGQMAGSNIEVRPQQPPPGGTALLLPAACARGAAAAADCCWQMPPPACAAGACESAAAAWASLRRCCLISKGVGHSRCQDHHKILDPPPVGIIGPDRKFKVPTPPPQGLCCHAQCH